MEELTVRQKNHIIDAVNRRLTPEEAGLCTPVQLEYYRIIYADAQSLLRRGGVWPVFELWELE